MRFDVDSIVNRLETSLRAKSAWKDILFFGANERLIRIFAEALAEEARYDEYLTRETKWSLARNVSSLLKGARVLNYDAHRQIGARGKVRVSAVETFDVAPPVTIDIPKYTVFSNGDDTRVTAVNNNNIVGNADSYIDVDVIQGEPKTFTTNAVGDLGEVVTIDNRSIENSFYELFVNGTLWEEATDLRFHDGNAEVYKVENEVDFSGVRIVFGDNLNGKKLNSGDMVTFRYIETKGADGNVTKQGVVTTVESTLQDINGDTVDAFCTNIDPISGGKKTETIEDIRTNAPSFFQTGDRAITREDYRVLLEQNNNVLKATVWGVYEINEEAGTPGAYIPDEENYIYVAAVSTSNENLTTTIREEVRGYINEFKSPTDVISFQDVEFINLIFDTDVYIRDRSEVLSNVKSRVLNALSDAYEIENTEFNQNLYESDYMALIDGVEGVDYHNTNIRIASFSTFNSADFEADIPLALPEIQKESVKVYVKHTSEDDSQYQLAAIDDGAGEFTAQNGFTVDPVGSSVNYITGESTITISGGLPYGSFPSSTYQDYDIKYEHQIVSDNFILQKRQQIFSLFQSNVTTQYV